MASASWQRQRGGAGWGSPERRVVWTEQRQRQRPRPGPSSKKVGVVYYLCRRDGQLEQPHLVEVELPPSAPGLYLRDFTARLNKLRGDAMADTYSWSCKRGYKNSGYVWQDLTEEDLIHPSSSSCNEYDEYVLKGSQLLLGDADNTSSSSCRARAGHRRNWSSSDLGGSYKVNVVAPPPRSAADQTEHRREEEIGTDEISPPPSSSSPDDTSTTLETLIGNDAGVAATTRCEVGEREKRGVGGLAGGRMRASALLMQLISCGSVTVNDHRLPPQRHIHRSRRSTTEDDDKAEEEVADDDPCSGSLSISGGGAIPVPVPVPIPIPMERDYFSGSLVESSNSTTTTAATLRRSSSYNADAAAASRSRSREVDGVRAKCIPRKPKSSSSSTVAPTSRREANAIATSSSAAAPDGVVDSQDNSTNQ